MLDKYRLQIDEIDKQLVELLERRFDVTDNVAKFKLENNKAIYDAKREDEKIQSVTYGIEDDFEKLGVEHIFRQIMSISRANQYRFIPKIDFGYIETQGILKNASIGIQGLEGSYAQAASLEIFGKVDTKYYKTFSDVVNAVADGKVNYGVLPIENSVAGDVGQVLDAISDRDVSIVKQHISKISHCLVGKKNTKISDVRKVYSHVQALNQCKNFFIENPNIEAIEALNTAVAAKLVADDDDLDIAAIASWNASELYGLEVIKENVQNSDNNSTSFVVISSNKEKFSKANTITIAFKVPHRTGSLYNALSYLIYNGINMSRIISRPAKEEWEYVFFVTIDGSLSDANIVNALSGMKNETIDFRILGNY